MVDMSTLYTALQNADAAGDTEGAKRLAQYIQSLQQPAAQEVPPTKPTSGALSAGFQSYEPALQEAYGGLKTLAGVAAERVLGKGDVSKALIESGAASIQEAKAKQEPLITAERSSFGAALDKGIGSVLTEWLPYQAGSGAANILESLAITGAGALIGSAAAPGPGTVAGAATGLLAKEIAKRGIKEAAEKVLAEQGEKAAADFFVEQAKKASVDIGKKIGATTATAGMAGMAATRGAGEVTGRAVEEAEKAGGTASDIDLGRVAPAAAIHAIAEFVSDKIGLGALDGLGKEGKNYLYNIGKNILVTGTKESPTEIVQSMAERYGAKLSLTDAQAIKEYVDSVAASYAMSTVPGTVGGVRQTMAAREEEKNKPAPPVEPITPTTPAETIAPEQIPVAPEAQLTPQEKQELERQRAMAQPAEDVMGALQGQIQTAAPTTQEDVVRIRDEHEAAVVADLLAQDQEMKASQEAARRQMEIASGTESQDAAIEQVNQRVRESRLLSRVQNLIDLNIPFASTAINDINQKFGVINEAPLNEDERIRVQNIMGMAQVFTNFVNLPKLPEVQVDRFAENQALEQLIKEKKDAADTLRAETAAPSNVVPQAPVPQGAIEGESLRPEGGFDLGAEEDRKGRRLKAKDLSKLLADQITTEPTGLEGEAAPVSPEVEELRGKVDEISAEKGKVKSVNLWSALAQKISPQEAIDISPDGYIKTLGSKTGGTVVDLVDSGALDNFLPINMRPGSAQYDSDESAEYIKEKIRNKNHLSFEAEMEIAGMDYTISQIESEIAALLEIEDVNRLISQTQAELSQETEAAISERKTEPTAPSEGKDARPELELKPTTPEGLRLKAAQEKAAPEAPEGEFVLTGSDRAADQARARGQMELGEERKSLRGDKTQQVQAFEKELRTLLTKFGLKDVGLNIIKGMQDEGSYAAKLIRIAADVANPIRTLRHEAIHALRELGFFTEAQWKSLEKMAKDKWIDQYLKQRNVDGKPLKAGEESRYDAYMREYKGDMEKITEEAVADAFADFDAGKPVGMIASILNRMRNLFQAIKSALTNVESPEQIFGKVEKGELKAGAREAKGEAKSLRDRATANFKRWFGDSKVVDADGEPLVVYHGTVVRPDTERVKGMGDIKAFDRMFTTQFRRPSIDTVGSWFSTNPGEGGAEMYSGKGAGSAIYPVYLSINNPQVTTFQLMLRRARLLHNGKDDGRVVGEAEVAAYRKWLKEMGKDGIKIEGSGNEGSTEFDNQVAWIALEPNQIKSATGNNGEYSLTDADIRKSLRSSQESINILEQLGRTKGPAPTLTEQIKTLANDTKQNPKKTAESALAAASEFLRKVENKVFSTDAALQKDYQTYLRSTSQDEKAITGRLIENSLSQTVHANAVAGVFLEYGGLKYDKEAMKWTGEKQKDNFIELVSRVNEMATKYGFTQEVAQEIAHRAAEAKRVRGWMKYNAGQEQKAEDLRAEADKIEGKSPVAASELRDKASRELKKKKQIHLTEQEVRLGERLFELHPELAKVSEVWNGIRDNASKVMMEGGLWSQEDVDALLANMDYVPFYREMEDGDGGPKTHINKLKVDAKEKRATGSMRPVNNIIDNQFMWVQHAVSRAVKNRSAITLADAAVEMGAGRRVRSGDQSDKSGLPKAENKQNVTRIWKDGKEQFFEMDDPLYMDAFNGMESFVLPGWKFLQSATNMLRQSVVMYPMFTIAQLPQDSFAAMFSSGLKPAQALKIPALAVKEFISTLMKKSATHEHLKKFGAVGVRDYSAAEIRLDAEAIAGLKGRKGFWSKASEHLHHFAMSGENAVRQAVYIAAKQQGLSEAEALEKTFEIFNARRRGTSRSLAIASQVIPFFNAYLAAQNVAYKTLMGRSSSPTSKKEAYSVLLKTSASVFALSMLYAMMAADDEDYLKKNAPIRDRMFVIPGTGGLGIPIRTDMFALPKVLAEHIYLTITDKGYEDPKKFRQAMWSTVVESVLSPTPLPQAIKPALEVMTNYNFLQKRPLVGEFLKDKDVERQFTESTSEMAKILGQTGVMSPIAIDHMIRGMFGSFGGLMLYSTNFLISAGSDVERPDLSVKDMLATLPGTSGFISKEYESGLKRDFYELRDVVDKAANTMKDMAQRSPGKVEDYLSDETVRTRVGMQKGVTKIAEKLTKIRQAITYVSNSDMTGAEKKERISQLRDVETEMLKNVDVKALRKMAEL